MKTFLRRWLGVDADIAAYKRAQREHEERIRASQIETAQGSMHQYFEHAAAIAERDLRDEFARAALCGGCAPDQAYTIADQALEKR